jgi:predicted  nucleic acid-binding Zn-ribbon protein
MSDLFEALKGKMNILKDSVSRSNANYTTFSTSAKSRLQNILSLIDKLKTKLQNFSVLTQQLNDVTQKYKELQTQYDALNKQLNDLKNDAIARTAAKSEEIKKLQIAKDDLERKLNAITSEKNALIGQITGELDQIIALVKSNDYTSLEELLKVVEGNLTALVGPGTVVGGKKRGSKSHRKSKRGGYKYTRTSRRGRGLTH